MARNSKISFVNVGTISQSLLLASEKRVAIKIFGSAVGRVTISNDSPAVLDNGATFVQSVAPISLTKEQDGGIVSAPFFAIAALANSIVGIIEVMEG